MSVFVELNPENGDPATYVLRADGMRDIMAHIYPPSKYEESLYIAIPGKGICGAYVMPADLETALRHMGFDATIRPLNPDRSNDD